MAHLEELNPRQRAFVLEYVKDKNGKQAAIKAGYSPKTAEVIASRLLTNIKVQACVEELLRGQANRSKVSGDRVLVELGRIAICDIGGAYNDNNCFKAIKDIPEDVRRAISAVKTKEIFNEDGEKEGETIEVKFWNKVAGGDLLGKHHDLWAENIKITGINPHSIHDIDQMILMLQRLKKAKMAEGER